MNKNRSFLKLCQIIAFLSIFSVAGKSFCVELMIDVDAYDNYTVAKHWYNIDVYGPEQIAEFFKKCKENNIKSVYWRSHCQTAAYRSKVNYSLADERSTLSHPDSRHLSGGYAAKIGTDKRNGGIFQVVQTQAGQKYALRAWISATGENTACLKVVDAKSGKIIAIGKDISNTGDSFVETELSFTADGPSIVGVVGKCTKDMCVFVVDDISLFSEKGIELIQNGRMEQIYGLVPVGWNPGSANFLVLNGDPTKSAEGKRLARKGLKGYWEEWSNDGRRVQSECRQKTFQLCDPLTVAVKEAHANGIKIYAWIDPLDEGGRRYPGSISWWVSRFHEFSPEFRTVDKNGNRRWGMLCFGYKEVRDYKNQIVRELLAYGVDGIYFKTTYQHNMIWDGKGMSYDYEQFVYNDVALQEYDRRWGKPGNGEYDQARLKIVYGDFFSQWVKEASKIIHDSGKKLSYSVRASYYLEKMEGCWYVDWGKFIDEKIIDVCLYEPRHSRPHRGYFERIDRQWNLAERCQKAGVKLGFDFYLNGVAQNEILPKMENPHKFFVDEVAEVARWPIDFIGIYEGMYLDVRNFWADIEEINKRIEKITPLQKIAPVVGTDKTGGMNVAAKINGANASFIASGIKTDASMLIDGCIDDGSIITFKQSGEIIVNFAKPEKIAEIRIYPGIVAYAANPSGECGIRRYRLEGMSNGKWIPLCKPIEAAPTAKEAGKMFTDFFYIHDVKLDIPLDAIRLCVIQGSDTGCRVSSPDKSIVPENERVINIRELEAYPIGQTPSK